MKDNTVWMLRRSFKKTKADIWRALEKEIGGSRSNRREINIRRLSQISKPEEILVVPGKILGAGNLGHKLTVCAFSISENAVRKIITAGGKVITFEDLLSTYPEGKGVRIIG
jgi:large subunit ribosomal protein L18e